MKSNTDMTTDEHKANQYKWLAEFFAEAAKTGRAMQKCNKDGTWKSWADGPGLYSNKVEWRLKPEPIKAFVVWHGKTPVCVTRVKSAAEEVANRWASTIIQEINRPEPQ